MIAPRTTTLAIVSIRRSSLPSGSAAIREILLCQGEENMVHELHQELVVERLARDQGAGEDDRAGDVGEQGRHGADLAARTRAIEQRLVARALVNDNLVAKQGAELGAGAELAEESTGDVRIERVDDAA